MAKQIRGQAGPTQHEVRAIIAELEKKGVDPMSVRSCLPQSGMLGHVKGQPAKGCNCFDVCPFGSTRFGAFKGQGPKNVKIYIDPNDGSGRKQELPFTCFHVAMNLLSRMKGGIAALEKNLPGEIIDVVGGEPGVVIPGADPKSMNICRTKVWVKKHPELASSDVFVSEIQRKAIKPFEYDEEDREDTFEAELGRQQESRMSVEKGGLSIPSLPQSPRAWDADSEAGEEVSAADLDRVGVDDNLVAKVPAAEPVGKKGNK